ncbi:arsenite efflux transporter metallochaperone ArsD [Cryobacterium sp. TMT2-18-3]|uniref:arsenite efflux transporter metallochaperone ArsD n=1 Tax=unclassified Cryobacterium TaxID=2649013 RepID=UPI001069E587|nr:MULTISPECIES: arsenite efflux transporter metallochaperone ArsD [unclassified Cryobacterium]TFC29890.1 arsenite efflux transporter metallochaperone ArsD [Cryobacterium sp. TMT2-18-2]TFC55805.1 arsenite efflux transporter metallochaperone ArsD [Cryobacterium sp. TMT2-15-1]TFC66077.1 arsenite efflux transporter metallochaperone ArsD [Cryobacterium sp. TMT2-18-3]
MARIEIFEPGLCCGTGICGVDVDQALVTFSADLDFTRANGGDIARFNLAQEPLAFVENEVARQFLHTVGQEGLPVTLVGGATVLTGRYPTRAELANWTGVAAVDTGAASHRAAVQPEGAVRLLAMAGSGDATATETAENTAGADAGCCGNGGCC